MKTIIYVVLILLNVSTYGQEVFEYEFDDNITFSVLEDTEEGELPDGKFIKGIFENEVFSCSSSNKAEGKLASITESGLLKLFAGVKDGNLRVTKGTLINEEIISIENTTVSHFKFSCNLEGKNKIIETYVFTYKNLIYTFQFMNNADEFEKFTTFRKSIFDSITLK